MEGVAGQPLMLVERGILQGFLLTRQPVKGASRSNGRGRLPGAFGAKTASISNLFVSASETVTASALRQKLIDLCRQRGKPYGLVVRKLDFPSSGDLREIRRMATGARQRGGSGRLVSRPPGCCAISWRRRTKVTSSSTWPTPLRCPWRV
jgi:hypothetical protein